MVPTAPFPFTILFLLNIVCLQHKSSSFCLFPKRQLKIITKYRAMITNGEKLALFDMLPTRNKADLLTYFKTCPARRRSGY